jgi:hypothetical protein
MPTMWKWVPLQRAVLAGVGSALRRASRLRKLPLGSAIEKLWRRQIGGLDDVAGRPTPIS